MYEGENHQSRRFGQAWRNGRTIVCTIALTLSEADRKNVVASLLPVVGSTRVQPGCQVCSMLIDVDDPRVLVLWQEWLTQGDLDRHLRSADYRLVLAAMELSMEPPRITFDRVRQRSGLEAIEAVRLGGEAQPSTPSTGS